MIDLEKRRAELLAEQAAARAEMDANQKAGQELQVKQNRAVARYNNATTRLEEVVHLLGESKTDGEGKP